MPLPTKDWRDPYTGLTLAEMEARMKARRDEAMAAAFRPAPAPAPTGEWVETKSKTEGRPYELPAELVESAKRVAAEIQATQKRAFYALADLARLKALKNADPPKKVP